MAGPTDFLDEVASIAEALRNLGVEPVLVGGMALVILEARLRTPE